MYTKTEFRFNTHLWGDSAPGANAYKLRHWFTNSEGSHYAYQTEVGSPSDRLSIITDHLGIMKSHPNSPYKDSISFSGEKPAVDVHYFSGKHKLGSSNFRRDCNLGIIVSHPYTAYSGRIRAGEVWTQVSSASYNIQPFIASPYKAFGKTQGYFRDYKYQGNNVDTFSTSDSQVWWLGDGSVTVPSVNTTSIMTSLPLNGEVVRSVEQFAISSLDAMNDVLVTETLAKANDKEIDLLTTLAEMPKTVASVINGFKLLTEMTKAAKKREFEITKSYAQFKKNTAKLEYSRYKNALAKKRASLSKRKRNVPDKTLSFERWSNLNESKLASQTAVEITDAITSVWMNYRYNIRPIVYTIQDSVDVVDRWKNQYLTVRTVQTLDLDPVEIPGHTFQGTSKITHRCWIKRRYDTSDDWNNFQKVVMGDIFVTAYELVPVASIIADWFFNIGPVLRAASYNKVYTQEAATYSVKVEIKGSYFLDTDPTVFYDVEYTGYKRNNITPVQHVALRYVNEFDDLKGFDLLSFFWSGVRKPVRKIPYPI